MIEQNISDLMETEDAVILGKERHHLALQAALEIGSLCYELRDAMDGEPNCTDEITRGMTSRIHELANSIIAAISDRQLSTSDLHYKVEWSYVSK